MDSNIDNKKKRLKLYYGLLVTFLVVIGVSFAYFRLTKTQTNSNVIGTRSCLDTTLTEETSEITLSDAFPISDEDGMKQTPFTFTLTNNCDSYVKVTIALVSEYRTSTDSSHLKDDHVKTNLSTKGLTDGKSKILNTFSLAEVDTDTEGYTLKTTGLNNKESKSFDLRLWLDSETTNEQVLNKTWKGKIVVSIVASEEPPAAPKGWYDSNDGTLLASLRDNNDLNTPLTIPGREVSAHILDDVESFTLSGSSAYQSRYITYGTGWETNGTKFNLIGAAVTSDTYANSYSSLVGKYLPTDIYNAGSNTAGKMIATTSLDSVYYVESATSSSITYKPITSNKNITEALLASTEDDYGTSYYFRGAVKNNYVQFANKCWRIVRINGDGSVKLVLHNDNTSGATNPCSSANNSDGAAYARYNSTYGSVFNSISNDNAYVGFMYGTAGSSDYASTHANTNKSTILTNLETWYTNNNLASYEDKLADTIWCNDKSTITTLSNGSTYGTGLGYGTSQTGYGAYKRIIGGPGSNDATLYANPSLICPNDNNGGKLSKFTVNDTTNGNGTLTYKIGLLTADEIAFSGSMYGYGNPSIYLRENTSVGSMWWTSSPNISSENASGIVVSVGQLAISTVNSGFNIRPAVSLVSDIEISGGSGTSEDPYVVD